MSSFARVFGLAIGSVLGFAATSVSGAGPADVLLKLVPPDAAATLVIEDLRGHARGFLGSPQAKGFWRLPAVRTWVASDRFRRFDQARLRIETVLGEKLSTIRDELLGDSVVLAIRLPANGHPEEARGLLLIKVRDRPLLDRLIQGVNAAQRRSGELTRLTSSSRGGIPYWTREFRQGSQRPTDHYTILDDHTFAWSNSEELIQGVIDRNGGKASALAGEARFQRIRQRLPDAAVSLYVNPVFLMRLLALSTRSPSPSGDRATAMLGRYLGALEYFGAAVEWQDGLLLRTEETLNPATLDTWILRWAARSGTNRQSLRLLPPDALAIAAADVDFNAILDACRGLVPPGQQPRLENLLIALDGILLGHKLEDEILPRLGPGVLAYLDLAHGDNPAPGARLSKTLIVALDDAPEMAASVENAMKTLLALYAAHPRSGRVPLRIETRAVEGRNVTTLMPTSPIAFAIDGNRLVLGSSGEDVARDLALAAAEHPAGGLARLRDARFPQAKSFACVDLARLHSYLTSHRGAIVARLAAGGSRTTDDAERDLDQAIASIALFRLAYFTSVIEPDATAVHRTLGLINGTAPPALAP